MTRKVEHKKMTRSEFTGLPIPQTDETSILALVAQREQLEQQMTRTNDAINATAVRVAKAAGWDEVPASELRFRRDERGMWLERAPRAEGAEAAEGGE